MSEQKQGSTYQLVLVRHGESVWNLENIFTGWVDVDLSDKGLEEAKKAGQLMRAEGFQFDIAYTSLLKRAIKTQFLALEQMDQLWIQQVPDWRLNERMYGGLQGLNKSQTAQKHGEDQVKIWRRSYDVPPPALDESSEYYPGNDRRYQHLSPSQIPKTECLKDTMARFMPCWEEVIAPAIRSGKRVLITAHGNSLRALVKHLDNISEADIPGLNIPTGVPLVYDLDDQLRPIPSPQAIAPLQGRYLGDPEEIARAVNAVASQAQAK